MPYQTILVNDVPGVENVMFINENIVACAQPEVMLGYTSLKDIFKIGISVNFHSKTMQKEVEAAGIEFIYMPFSDEVILSRMEVIAPDKLDLIITTIWNMSLRKKLNGNCLQGDDLTGTWRMATRLKYMGWSFNAALEERNRIGFHWEWKPLDISIRDFAKFYKLGGM